MPRAKKPKFHKMIKKLNPRSHAMEQIMLPNPDMRYKEFAVKWKESGKTKLPDSKEFANFLQTFRKRQQKRAELDLGHGTDETKRAQYIAPESDQSLKNRTTRTRKANIIAYCNMEDTIDQLLDKAKELKNNDVADGLRQVRRLVGAAVVNS